MTVPQYIMWHALRHITSFFVISILRVYAFDLSLQFPVALQKSIPG